MKFVQIGVILLTTLAIVSCGGGGGGTTTPPPAPVVEPPPPPPITHNLTVSQAPENATAYLNTPAQVEFTWQFTSTGSATARERYTLSSDPAGVEFDDAERLVSHGNTVTTGMTYRCSEVGVVDLTITVTIVSSNTQATFDWQVDCQLDPDDQIVLDIKFYQGPLVGVMEAKLGADGWYVGRVEHTWPDFSFTRQHSVSTNRRTFVEVDLPRQYAVNTDITLRFPHLPDGETVERVLLTTEQETRTEGEEDVDYFVRRAAYDVSRLGVIAPNVMHIEIQPASELPQINTTNNVVRVDLTELQTDDLPEMKLLIIPIRWELGVVEDIDDHLEDVLGISHNVLPLSEKVFRIGAELDLTGLDEITPHIVLERVRIAGREHSEPNEYVHSIYRFGRVDEKRLNTLCGVAQLGGRAGISGGGPPFASGGRPCSRSFAHEIGHNLSLGHPNEGDFALYPDGGIGVETGWRLSNQQRVVGHFINIMKPGINAWESEFITQQYFGKAKRHFIAANPVTAASVPPALAHGFDIAEGKSFVIVGNHHERDGWSVVHDSAVSRTPFPQESNGEHTLRLVHTGSGTELYRTGLPVYGIGCGTGEEPGGWSARIPAYRGTGLSVEILDRANRVVFVHDMARVEL